jgi:hypothetical protein
LFTRRWGETGEQRPEREGKEGEKNSVSWAGGWRALRASKSHDVIDASVALLARRQSARVVTSDPEDLHRIDASLDLVVC